MSFSVKFSNSFKTEMRIAQKQGKNLNKLYEVIDCISTGKDLAPCYRLHKLVGDFKGCFECHIEPDWLLIFKVYENDVIVLSRLGSHSEIFK